MNIHIVEVPSALGARSTTPGADKGPQAIRIAGLSRKLRENQLTVIDAGEVTVDVLDLFPMSNPRLKNLEPILGVCKRLSLVVEDICRADGFPLVIGGDHSVSLGSISGVARALGSIGVIWIDAHGDFNTHETTSSGNIHGMPLAALAGLGDERLVHLDGLNQKVPAVAPANIALVGIRDLDPGEKDLLDKAGVHVFTMENIDREGIARIIRQALEVTTTGTNGVHVSFDIDSLDPLEAQGTGTPVPGGLTYREARLAMELIWESGQLKSLDMVEVNPNLDHDNRTAELAVELIISALGRHFYRKRGNREHLAQDPLSSLE